MLVGAALTEKKPPTVKPAPPPPAAPAPKPRPKPPASKVLVADNDRKRRDAIRARIEERVAVAERPKITEVGSAQEAAELLMRSKGGFEVVFLDHDFGTSEWTGLDVAKILVLLPDAGKPKMVYVHSRNPMGAARVVALLVAGGIQAQRVVI